MKKCGIKKAFQRVWYRDSAMLCSRAMAILHVSFHVFGEYLRDRTPQKIPKDVFVPTAYLRDISCWNISFFLPLSPCFQTNPVFWLAPNKNKNTVSRKSINRFLRLCPFLPNNNGGHNNNAGLFVNSC